MLRATALAGVPLVVAGTGPLHDDLMRSAPQGTRFVGHVDGTTVDALLASARAAVVPSEWPENAPMAVLEPMALARPVIASRIGGIPEQIRDGREGFLFNAGDVVGLAAALRVLSADASLADSLGRAARHRAETRFRPSTHTDGLLRIYDDVLRRCGTGGNGR